MVLQKMKSDSKIRKFIFSNLLLDKYNEYASSLNELDITNDTKEWRLKHIRGLLYYLETKKIQLNDLNPNIIYEYLNTISDLSIRTREHRAVCIRLFLDWCYKENVINFKGSQILKNIKCNKNENLITYYSNEEIIRIINSVDTNLKNGKRDLAIILLLSYLGLRTKDIINLKLENIKWNENRIIIVHHKNNTLNSFYMDKQIRYAIIDYLKNERINLESKYLFINKNNNKLTSHIIYNIVNKYFKLANIDTKNKKHGPHALRHSLATSLLNDNNSIFEISNILGHQDISNTTIYLRIDLNHLKRFSLEVPKCKN